MQLANPKLFLNAFAEFWNPTTAIAISSLRPYINPFVYLYVRMEYGYKMIIQ